MKITSHYSTADMNICALPTTIYTTRGAKTELMTQNF
jgi:hypothetical protein